jgi:hypothetical protein
VISKVISKVNMYGMNVNADEFMPMSGVWMVWMDGMSVSGRLFIKLSEMYVEVLDGRDDEMYDELEREFELRNEWIFE